MAHRLQAMGQKRYKDGFAVRCHPEALDEPLKWKKPHRIFVCSMADLFHNDVPFEFIVKVFCVMQLAQYHTFLVLTKRPDRMMQFYQWLNSEGKSAWLNAVVTIGLGEKYKTSWSTAWPFGNIWLGVTAENQEQADKRIPILLQIPAAKRFVSVEPMLGAVDILKDPRWFWAGSGLDWVICGGESGPGARPMHPNWVRILRDQCQAAGVPFLFKQWGEWLSVEQVVGETMMYHVCASKHCYLGANGEINENRWDDYGFHDLAKVGKKKAGRLLDGRLWDEYPEVTP